MKCDMCEQELEQTNLVDDGMGGFVCRGCKQESDAGLEAYLTSMGLGTRQQVIWDALCCRYLQARGWKISPPIPDGQTARLIQQVDSEITADKDKLDKDCPWLIYLAGKMCFRPDKRRTRAIISKLNEMAVVNEDDGPEYKTFGEVERGEFDFAERPTLSSAAKLLQGLLDFNDDLS